MFKAQLGLVAAASLVCSPPILAEPPPQEPLYFAVSPGFFVTSSVRDGNAESVALQLVLGLPSRTYSDRSYELTLFGTSVVREQDGGDDSIGGFDLSVVQHYGPRHADIAPFSAIGIGATIEDIQNDRDQHLSLSFGGGVNFALGGYSKIRTDLRGLVTRNDIDEQGSRFLVDGRIHIGVQIAVGNTYGHDPLLEQPRR